MATGLERVGDWGLVVGVWDRQL